MVIGGIVVATLVVLGLLFCPLFWKCENSTRPFSTTGEVSRKEVRWVYLSRPLHFGLVPSYPPVELVEYRLMIEVGPEGLYGESWVTVDQELFETVQKGQQVDLICRRGGIMGRLKVLEAQLL